MISEIYEDYFQIIEDHYGRYFKEKDPFESTNRLLKKPMTSRILYETSDTIISEINELLIRKKDTILSDIASLEGITTNFTGGVAPQDAEKFLCRSGLYADTTIISDPLTFIQSSKSLMSNKPEFVRLLVRYAFNMLKLKKAMINDSEKPILRIIPRPIFMNCVPDNTEVENQTLDYFNGLFHKEFKSVTELEKFLSGSKSKKELISNIKNSNLLIPEITEASDIDTGFESFYAESNKYGFNVDTFADMFYSNVEGSIIGNLSHFNFSKEFRLINSFESPNAWHYFKWMLRNESKNINDQTFVLNSITLNKVKWFGNLKLEEVIKAREQSFLQDFREILHKEINYMDEDKNIKDVGKQLESNLQTAFSKHQEEINKIEAEVKWDYYVRSTGIVAGTISLLNGVYTNDVVSYFTSAMLLPPSLVSWFKPIKDNKKSKLLNSPVGILFNAKGN